MIKIPKQTIISKVWKKKWVNTVVMCGVHGNEIVWIVAINELVEKIRIDSWSVFFIYANLLAIKNNTRFFDKNMNRLFKDNNLWCSYEEIRIKEIKKYLNKSDFLLDLHSSNSKISKPFLITEHTKISNIFPVDIAVSGFEKIESWWSDWYMDYIWGKWFCLESGNIKDVKWVKLAKKSILNFLKFTWNIDWKYQVFSDQSKMKLDKLYKTNSNKFVLMKEFKDFEKIKKWQVIWVDWNQEVISNYNSKILFARNRNKKWDEGFILLKTT